MDIMQDSAIKQYPITLLNPCIGSTCLQDLNQDRKLVLWNTGRIGKSVRVYVVDKNEYFITNCG